MNEDEHELGKAIFGLVLLSGLPIIWMIWLLFN